MTYNIRFLMRNRAESKINICQLYKINFLVIYAISKVKNTSFHMQYIRSTPFQAL